jgi:hypothetical protein
VAILVFDIETGPRAFCELRRLYTPLAPSEVKGVDPADLADFAPESVRYGNTTDPTKRAAKLAESRAKHQVDQAAAMAKVAKAQEEDWDKFVERAPLDARFGCVAAIGYRLPDGIVRIVGNASMSGVNTLGYRTEEELLTNFWAVYAKAVKDKIRIVGHNIFGFDLPFLRQRSWILGVPVPESILDKDRYWSPIFADTMTRWGCGVYGARSSLDSLAKAFACGGKPEGEDACTGALFHTLFAEKATHAKAVEYLKNDLEMTWGVAARLGIA